MTPTISTLSPSTTNYIDFILLNHPLHRLYPPQPPTTSTLFPSTTHDIDFILVNHPLHRLYPSQPPTTSTLSISTTHYIDFIPLNHPLSYILESNSRVLRSALVTVYGEFVTRQLELARTHNPPARGALYVEATDPRQQICAVSTNFFVPYMYKLLSLMHVENSFSHTCTNFLLSYMYKLLSPMHVQTSFSHACTNFFLSCMYKLFSIMHVQTLRF